MSTDLPSVTIVVPARPGQSDISVLDAVRALDYPREQIEMLVARGRQPAAQRNAALKIARGELVYFLDDDSRPAPDNLRRAVPRFSDARIKMVGGPSLCPADAPLIEQVFAVTLGSWLAFGPSRARYDAVGALRATSEKELILCNLMARRDALIDLGGFDESLYPNEENALMDDLQKRDAQLIYDPQFVVRRRPRPTLKAFCNMLLNYGRGRAEQFRRHPTSGSILNFVPAIFVLWLLSIPFHYLLLLTNPLLSIFLRRGDVLLALIYGLAMIGQTVWSGFRHGFRTSLPASPLIPATHVLYGLGFWYGLFTTFEPRDSQSPHEVSVEKIAL